MKLVQRLGMIILPPVDHSTGRLDDFEVPEELEDLVEYLLNGLCDSDTIVRWSAAKGLGRLTSRLPQVPCISLSCVPSMHLMLSE